MKTYTIEHDLGLHPLTAKTDIGAIRQMRSWLKANPSAKRPHLAFFRQSDGQKGFINPSGNAVINGEAWR